MTFFLTNFYKKHTKLVLSIFLFLIVFISLGLPFKNWWLTSRDSYLSILQFGYKTKNWKWLDLLYFFYEGHTEQIIGDPTYIRKSFLTVFYRPFYCIFFFILYRLFGLSIYYYFLLNVFFHGINVVLLFYIFNWFLSYFTSFLLALFFAFHPIIGWTFGATIFLHYYVNLTLMLLVVIFLKQFLEVRKYRYYIFSILCLIISLFTREVSILFPIVIFGGIYLYFNRFSYHLFNNFLNRLLITFKFSLPFLVTSLLFLLLRLYLYPLKLINSGKFINFLFCFDKLTGFFKKSLIYAKLFIYDLFGISLIPWTSFYRPFRFIIFLSVVFILLWLFIKNSRKTYIIYFLISALIMVWPAYVRCAYFNFYFYEIYYLIFLALIFLFKYYQGTVFPVFRSLLIYLLFFIVSIFFVITFKCFCHRENRLHLKSQAIKSVINDNSLKNKKLYFVGVPEYILNRGVELIFWVYLNKAPLNLFIDFSTSPSRTDTYLNKIPDWKTFFGEYALNSLFPIKSANIFLVNKGIRCISFLPSKLFFHLKEYSGGRDVKGPSPFSKIVNNFVTINNEQFVTDYTILIDFEKRYKNSVFITWDYEKLCFKILKNDII